MSVFASAPAQAASGVRFRSIDGLRGLLASIVFAYHLSFHFGSTALLSAANFSVCAFFVMSGYVLTSSYDGNFGAFLVKRFVRLWPVFALCLALGYLVEGVAPTWTQFFWYPVLTARSLPAVNPPIWSLCIEAWAMLFMPLIVRIGRGPPVALLAGVVVIGLAGSLDVRMLFGLFFVAGAFASRLPFSFRLLDGPLLQAMGRISYSLYLVHAPILAYADRHYGRLGLALSVPFIVATAWCLCRFVDEPSVRLSRALSRRIGRARPSAFAQSPRAALSTPLAESVSAAPRP